MKSYIILGIYLVQALNPILENNALIFVESGKIDEMNFSLTTNNTKAIGSINLLYHDFLLFIDQ